MSNPNPIVNAAVPEAIAVLQAVQQFFANLGTDPVQVAAKFPGAISVLLGTVEMQLPALATSEFGAAQAVINGKIAAWIASLQAKVTPAPAPAPTPPAA